MELRMRKQIALGTVLALGVGAQAIAAEGFSYNNVEAAFIKGKISVPLDGGEGLSAKGDGFQLSGSAAFGENLFGFASFGSLGLDKFKIDGVSVDAGGAEVKVKPLSLGVGFHWALSPNLDFVSSVSFERLKVSLSEADFSESANGYGLGVGLRGRVGESLELTGNLKYVDIEESDFVYGVGGRYYFTPAFAVGIDYSKYDDSNLTNLGISLRYDFGG
jgi:hypothetical protein